MSRLLLIILMFPVVTAAQTLKVSGSFNQDSIKIGEELSYSLSIRYLNTKDVVFPDSLFDFSPFELNHKLTFPTRSDSVFSYDSAVYFLSTFELDTFQTLDLPLFMVTSGDSLYIRPGLDSIELIHVVAEIPDSIALKSNTAYTNVNLNFNYPYFIVGGVSLLLLSLILFFAFGKSIRRRILLYRLSKLHRNFIERFNSEIAKAEQTATTSARPIEILINDWKAYMEKLNKQPFTKLTTREISILNTDSDLIKALSGIDKAIYGNLLDKSLINSFHYLRTASETSYQSKIEALKNG